MIIRYYDPSYLMKQLDLTREVVKNWTYFHFRYEEELMKRYSGDDYKKEQNIYLFDEHGNLLGFTELSFIATPKGTTLVQFPIVKQDGKKKIYIERIMEEIKKVLQKYNFPTPIMRIGHDWIDIETFTEDFNLTYYNDFGQFVLYNLEDMDFEELFSQLPLDENKYTPEQDDQALFELVSKTWNLEIEKIEQSLVNLRKLPSLVKEIVYKPKDKILGFGYIRKHEVDMEFGFMGHVYTFNTDNEKIRSAITLRLLHAAKLYGIKKVSLNSPSKLIKPEIMYQDLNVPFSQFGIWKFNLPSNSDE